jgi:AraC family transcriptional regulator of adaptative response/methylated-DNA-[protein]-cysteine methyltransferase
VRTTGVYCQPSCPSRGPRCANVAFHATRADAEAAGFRPCLRCKPDQPPLAERQAAAVAQACRLIDAAVDEPDLASLAEACGMSRFHFHRVFKAHTGITPKAYAAARRASRSAGAGAGATVTEAIYDAGFNSSGRFYAAACGVLGMTPKKFRGGGAGTRSASRWRLFAGRAPGGGDRQRGSARSCWATIRTCWCATCRTASRRPS